MVIGLICFILLDSVVSLAYVNLFRRRRYELTCYFMTLFYSWFWDIFIVRFGLLEAMIEVDWSQKVSPFYSKIALLRNQAQSEHLFLPGLNVDRPSLDYTGPSVLHPAGLQIAAEQNFPRGCHTPLHGSHRRFFLLSRD